MNSGLESLRWLSAGQPCSKTATVALKHPPEDCSSFAVKQCVSKTWRCLLQALPVSQAACSRPERATPADAVEAGGLRYSLLLLGG